MMMRVTLLVIPDGDDDIYNADHDDDIDDADVDDDIEYADGDVDLIVLCVVAAI